MSKRPTKCSGACCESFYLYGELEEEESPEHFELIQFMLIPKRLWPTGEQEYTCKFYDTVEKRCEQHEIRPNMCRDYPQVETGACESCTMTPEENLADMS